MASATAGMVEDDLGERVGGGVALPDGAELAGLADGDPEPFLDVLDLLAVGHAGIRLGDAAHGNSVAHRRTVGGPTGV